MQLLVSLSHEIRVEKQDVVQAPMPTDAQQTALDQQEQQRIINEYGIDTPKDEVAEKEEDRIKREEEQEEDKKRKAPADLGQRKPIEDKDVTATDIQNQHDDLTKI